jgi:hypothetical protein
MLQTLAADAGHRVGKARERVLSSLPPAARATTQRLAGQVLARVAQRWPALAGAIEGRLSTPPPAPSWQPPAPAREPAPPAPDPDLQAAEQQRVESLIHAARDAGSWRERRYAVRALAEHAASPSPDRIFEALNAAVGDATAEVGAAAVEALDAWAPLDDVRTTQALLSVLENASGYHASLVRALAARALGRRLAMDRSEPLLDAVGDADAEVSVSAILALAEGGFEGATDRLLGVLEEPTGYYLPLTRLTAARGLAILGATDATEAERLERVRGQEQDASVLQALPGSSAHPSV